MNYLLQLTVYLEIYVLIACSLNLLVGFGGLLQVSHAAYFGIGAYISAILMSDAGSHFAVAAAVAAVMTGIVGALFAIPLLRFRNDEFVMVALAIQIVLQGVFLNAVDLTGGPYGLSGIPGAAPTLAWIMVLYGGITVGGVVILGILQRSPFGVSLRAIRDEEIAAVSLGIPTRMRKVQAAAIASGLAGLAGTMYACFVSFIDPTSFTVDESIVMLSMVIVGGAGNLRGPILGACTLILLPELLRLFSLPGSIAHNARIAIFGALLIVLMRWRPQGIAGEYRFE